MPTRRRRFSESNLYCKVHTSCKLFNVLVCRLCSIVRNINVREDTVDVETCFLTSWSSSINTNNWNLGFYSCRSILAKFGVTNIEFWNWVGDVEIAVNNSHRKHYYLHITARMGTTWNFQGGKWIISPNFVEWTIFSAILFLLFSTQIPLFFSADFSAGTAHGRARNVVLFPSFSNNTYKLYRKVLILGSPF